MNLFFRSSLACLISVAFVASASAIEFQGGILGKLFNGEGCAHCEKETPAPAPEPTCECPAPEPAPEPEPTPCPCEAAPEPEPAPAPTIIYCCPTVVEAAPEPEPEPTPEAVPCCETIISESEPVVVEATVEAQPVVVEAQPKMAAEPIETIISEKIIYEGPVLSEVPANTDPAPASAPVKAEPMLDIFGPAASNAITPKYRLVFTPKNGWSTNRSAAKEQRQNEFVKTATLKKASGKPTFRLTFAKAKATKQAK